VDPSFFNAMIITSPKAPPLLLVLEYTTPPMVIVVLLEKAPTYTARTKKKIENKKDRETTQSMGGGVG